LDAGVFPAPPWSGPARGCGAYALKGQAASRRAALRWMRVPVGRTAARFDRRRALNGLSGLLGWRKLLTRPARGHGCAEPADQARRDRTLHAIGPARQAELTPLPLPRGGGTLRGIRRERERKQTADGDSHSRPRRSTRAQRASMSSPCSRPLRRRVTMRAEYSKESSVNVDPSFSLGGC
jgi:hypothetical protein